MNLSRDETKLHVITQCRKCHKSMQDDKIKPFLSITGLSPRCHFRTVRNPWEGNHEKTVRRKRKKDLTETIGLESLKTIKRGQYSTFL